MALLAEYALTPDIFDQSYYSNEEVAGIHLQHLKEVLLNEGIVRDLRKGEWIKLFSNNDRPWHKRGKELLKKLMKQNRLNRCPPALPTFPETDNEWCREALESHTMIPLRGIISTPTIADVFRGETLVAPINRLSSAPWWSGRSPSVRLSRNITSYIDNLKLILQCANSIMFIDPHLDPTKPWYGDFITILTSMSGRSPAPLIEVHRVCYIGSGPSRELIDESDWKKCFHEAWADGLREAGLSVHVFIWDDFHDRHIITDLIGISTANGFDTTTNPNNITTWTRLGRSDRDDVQREFDPASSRHNLMYRFSIL
jgi:hypothetical protein